MSMLEEKPATTGRSGRVKRESFTSTANDGDEVAMEYDIVVCDDIPNTELYRVQFPQRKKNAFDYHVQPRIRFKKSVKLMEMRLAADTLSASYDKTKADRMCSSGASIKQENMMAFNSKSDEIYEGRAFSAFNPIQYAMGFVRDDKFYLSPIAGAIDMHKTVSGMNAKGKDDDGDLTGESDNEAGTSTQQLRVKFARPETERQKKRREASALHREKMIANDPWISMEVNLNTDENVKAEWNKLTPKSEIPIAEDKTELRDLVQRAIICGKLEQLDLTGKSQMMSHLLIRELPVHLQVKAHLIKAQVISTSRMMELMGSEVSKHTIISDLRKCGHLVEGNWVLHSDLLFQNLPPAYSTTPGRIDEERANYWRCARDLALCLVDAGHRVTRSTLSKCFHLNSKDAEDILSTFGVKGNKTWNLKVAKDEDFLADPENLKLVVEEAKYWVNRFNELQEKIDSRARSVSPKRQRRNSGRGSPLKTLV